MVRWRQMQRDIARLVGAPKSSMRVQNLIRELIKGHATTSAMFAVGVYIAYSRLQLILFMVANPR